jgi:hypothetical protein
MNETTLQAITLLTAVVILIAALCAVLVGYARLQQRARTLELKLIEESSRLREELTRVAAQGLRIANHQSSIESQLRQLADRQGLLELRGEGKPFEQAREMLRTGASRDELVARFGLSDSEAGLLSQLHGRIRIQAARSR